MSQSRRNFIKHLGLTAGAFASGTSAFAETDDVDLMLRQSFGAPRYNMCGHRAPKIDKVKIGFIGVGNRGGSAVARILNIKEIEITCICDRRPEMVQRSQKTLEKAGLPKAAEFTGDNGWKDMLQRPDIDLVYICTPWSMHTPMAVEAMNNGKHVAVEVPAAKTLKECWDLVETSEKTKKHCMMLENCCYDFFELATLNMARSGVFGELVHAEGAYIHDLLKANFNAGSYDKFWRLNENADRDGNLYPTHGLGPIAQCLNINRGDKMDHMVSMSTNDFMMHDEAVARAASDPTYQQYTGKRFRGNMNTSVIKTNKGKTIMLQHDVTSPRPYSRIHLISGTKGIARKWPDPERIAFGHEWLKPKEEEELIAKYTPPIVKHIGEMAKKIGGHGGMDFIMDWRLVDSLRNGLPLDQDVYDAAAWSGVGAVSEISVKKNSRSVDIPDFTRGAWQTNTPVNLTLDGGATTTVRTK